MVRSSLVLAAGLSTRLGKPKQLIDINGHPLIWYPLSVLASIGVVETCIVTRREVADKIKNIANKIFGSGSASIIINSHPEKENGYSMLLGLKECFAKENGYVFVSMSDHIYSPYIAMRLSEAGYATLLPYYIAGDEYPEFIDVNEATKILADNIRGYRVGKDLAAWNMIDTGVHLVSPESVLALVASMGLDRGEVVKLNNITDSLAQIGCLGVSSFKQLPWTEIDTIEDLQEVLRGRRRKVVKHVIEWLRG
ncbi:hypothetical protein PYJP_15560 [Pyrofollis japonicus]|uniref:NTP transferase domain-containing protein n=1 Tax=Pyrofollis japonicus TaxID=3060460 RepID=UPI00295B0022|nr:NTP transferase domain-containing protein [Pyrofollis japonicus]BEP18204.1 hypothetical protein PYJP_15560 [Pyrofollis japonicus]